MKHIGKRLLFLLLALVFLLAALGCGWPAQKNTTAGKSPAESPALSLNFSPLFSDGAVQDETRALFDAIAPYCDSIHVFNVNEELYKIAKDEYHMRMIATCWIRKGQPEPAVTAGLQRLASLANQGYADILLIGSEGLVRSDYTAAQLIGWMKQLRRMLTEPKPVGTSDSAWKLLLHPNVSRLRMLFATHITPIGAESGLAARPRVSSGCIMQCVGRQRASR